MISLLGEQVAWVRLLKKTALPSETQIISSWSSKFFNSLNHPTIRTTSPLWSLRDSKPCFFNLNHVAWVLVNWDSSIRIVKSMLSIDNWQSLLLLVSFVILHATLPEWNVMLFIIASSKQRRQDSKPDQHSGKRALYLCPVTTPSLNFLIKINEMMELRLIT